VKMVFSSLTPESTRKKITDIIRMENINITDTGITTLIDMERDFRQLLNVLQGMHYFYITGEAITAAHVYRYMGKPSGEIVTQIITALFESTFTEANGLLVNLYKSNDISPLDIITAIMKKILTIKLAITKKHYIFELLAKIDSNLHNGCNVEIQIAYLVSGFMFIRSE